MNETQRRAKAARISRRVMAAVDLPLVTADRPANDYPGATGQLADRLRLVMVERWPEPVREGEAWVQAMG